MNKNDLDDISFHVICEEFYLHPPIQNENATPLLIQKQSSFVILSYLLGSVLCFERCVCYISKSVAIHRQIYYGWFELEIEIFSFAEKVIADKNIGLLSSSLPLFWKCFDGFGNN